MQFGRLSLSGLASVASGGDEISLTKKDGWEIKAVPVSLDGDRLKLKVNGQMQEIPLSSLNEARQRKVRELEGVRKR